MLWPISCAQKKEEFAEWTHLELPEWHLCLRGPTLATPYNATLECVNCTVQQDRIQARWHICRYTDNPSYINVFLISSIASINFFASIICTNLSEQPWSKHFGINIWLQISPIICALFFGGLFFYLPKICCDALKVMAKQATKRSAKARLTRK